MRVFEYGSRSAGKKKEDNRKFVGEGSEARAATARDGTLVVRKGHSSRRALGAERMAARN